MCVCRFALATASVCGRVGRGLALRSRAPESSPGRLGFRGFRSFDVLRALAMLAALNGRGWRTGGFHPLRPGSLRSKPLPTLPRQHLGGWRKTISIFLFGIGIDGPSRPRRYPRPTDRQGTGA